MPGAAEPQDPTPEADAEADAARAAQATPGAKGAAPGAQATTQAAAQDPGPNAARADHRMPRWLPRAVVLTLALYACFRFATWAFHQLTGLLLDILIAFFLALAIEPAVDRMTARGMRRGLATWVVFLGIIIGLAGFFTLLGSMLAGQMVTMVQDFPDYLDKVVSWVNGTFHTNLSRLEIQDSLLHSAWLRTYVKNSADNVLDVSAQVLGGLFQALTVALFAFYFAADGPRLRRTLCSVLPPDRQADVLRAWEIAVAKTGGYIYSRGLMALISGVAHYVLLQALGVPYAPVLGIWVGVISQFIPIVGTYLAGALPILIAFTVQPWYAVWVFGFVVVYQQFENYLLQPRITAKSVDIHPAVAFGSVIAGTALLGAVGTLIAIPATATLQAFLGVYIKRYEVRDDPRVDGRRLPPLGSVTAGRIRRTLQRRGGTPRKGTPGKENGRVVDDGPRDDRPGGGGGVDAGGGGAAAPRGR